MSILKGNQSDDLTLKYLLEKNRGGGGSGGVPEPATEPPEMDGTADVGSSEKYAREDHVHPTDTTRASQSSVNGKVSKSGDTMTGDLTVKEHIVKVKTALPSSTPAANDYENVIYGYDESGATVGYINLVHRTDGKKGIQLETVRDVNGTNVYNTVRLTVDASGNKAVTISADAWLAALGLKDITTPTSSVSDYASAASGFSLNSIAMRKWGKVLQVGIVVERTGSAISSDTTVTVATVKSAYRPAIYTSMMCSNTQFYHATIGTDGVMSVRVSGWSKNATKTFRTTYLLP